MSKTYTVSDGDLVLTLEALPQEDGGGYGVTSPLEPQLVTEAKTLEEAFAMARDAIDALREPLRRGRMNRTKVEKAWLLDIPDKPGEINRNFARGGRQIGSGGFSARPLDLDPGGGIC